VSTPPLDGLHVLDLSEGIAGAYGTKLLADLGADVVKVERPGGDPLRRWSARAALGAVPAPSEDSALFRYLHTSKRSVVAEGDDLLALAATADVVVQGQAGGVAFDTLQAEHPAAVLVSISPFGREGPRASWPATEHTLQGWSGSISSHGTMDRPPLAVGGRFGEWVAGTFAAVGALTAWGRARATGEGEHVDVSVFEGMVLTLATYPNLLHTGYPGTFGATFRWVMLPGVEPAADGWVGITTVTVQQWLDLLTMMGRDDVRADKELWTMVGRGLRTDDTNALVHSWTRQHTVDEIVELGAKARVPVAPVGNGDTLPRMAHLRARDLFVEHPGGGFVQPRPPLRLTASPGPPLTPAPDLGQHTEEVRAEAVSRRRAAAPSSGTGPAGTSERPLAGLKVLDFTAFWAGPFATAYLASMGADVVKVESVQRPDMLRFSSPLPPDTPVAWEKSGIFHANNLGKRSVTLDLTRPVGQDLARRLVAGADVVVENFTPRVMERFGLDYDALRAIRPDVVMLRMPAYGLDGPWRDRTGFAQTMEQLTGMAWVTGYPDGPPLIPGGLCDPLAGAHAVVALLAALEHRRRTGEGQLVEVAMVDVAANVTAEQVVERSAYGHLLEKDGNRGPVAAPQGVYRCAGDDRWVAVAVATDDQWRGLGTALGDPVWAADVALATAAGRRAAHDRIDQHLAEWCAPRSPEDAAATLLAHGVPAAPVVPAFRIDQDEQLLARGFYQELTHDEVGTHRYPGWPVRFSRGPHEWWPAPAPRLGQHNDEVLGERLGLTADELAALRADAVIGEEPLKTT
jgi:crotonobetainyl-CoA:carnitine CoA-transferase CaiB-like acyl-CoA transferase